MNRLGTRRPRIPSSRVQSKYFPMEGGLNLTDPALNMRAGECLAGVNHEPAIPRGYRRIGGYERFDGQPAPSGATYWMLRFGTGSVEIAAGDTITSKDGAIASQITARVLFKPVVTGGSWATNDAVGYVIIVEIAYAGSDTEFTAGDTLTYGADITWAKVLHAEEESGVDADILVGGRASVTPTDNWFMVLQFENGTNEPTVGDGSTIQGTLSTSVGQPYSTTVLESGSWAAGDAKGFIILANFYTNKFTEAEPLNLVSPVGGEVLFGTAVDAGLIYGSDTAGIYFYYLHAAQEDRRSTIEAVPGEGAVRGVWMFEGDVYAFRDKAGGATAGMYKATTAGWVEQTLGSQLGYTDMDLAGASPSDFKGLQVIGTTSGAVATIERITKSSGAYTSGDPATGELVLSGVSGDFVCGEQLVSNSAVIGVTTGLLTTNSLNPGGHYDFDNYNFYGSSQYYRMYGCNGVDNAFEWDGAVFVKISTGMESDQPTHIRAFGPHLYLAFRGGSLQRSSLGEPLEWNALSGAAEMGVGEDISGMVIEAEDTMTVLSRNSAHVLHTDGGTTDLKPFHQNVGAIEWTVQKIGQSWFLDDRGLTTLTLSDTYGNFRQNSVSTKVDPFIQARITDVKSSQIVRRKNQYRLYFGNGWALFGTFDGNKILGFMPIEYKVQPFCTESVEDEDGYEHLFMGCDDGFVYQQDTGTSFDGETIPASLMISYYHYDSPTYNKRFRGVTFEMDVSENTDIRFLPDFSYGSEEMPRAVTQQNAVVGGGSLWDYAIWDEFLWSGQVISTGRNRIDGQGANMGLMLFSDSKYLQPYTMQGATVAFSIRRLIR